MAEKEQQAYHPPTTNGYTRSNEEGMAAADPSELRRKKRIKWLIYIVAFIIFQSAIIAIFTLTIMKFRNPKFRVRSGTVDNLPAVGNPSFNFTLNARLGIKNTNFGPYKYEATTVEFHYKGTLVGTAPVYKSKANFRSTKKVDVMTNLSITNSELANDLSSGIVTLTSQATLNGKVTIMFLFKKKKSTNMYCTMNVDTKTKEIQNLACK